MSRRRRAVPRLRALPAPESEPKAEAEEVELVVIDPDAPVVPTFDELRASASAPSGRARRAFIEAVKRVESEWRSSG